MEPIRYIHRTRMEKLAERKERRRELFRIVIALTVLLAFVAVVRTINTFDKMNDERSQLQRENKRLTGELALEKKLARIGRVEGYAMVELGVPTTLDTPLGRLKITSDWYESDNQEEPPVRVWAKFLDYGYTWELDTRGNWGSHGPTGYDIQVAPTGYSCGYEYEEGSVTKIKETHQYFTVRWRKDPFDDPLVHQIGDPFVMF